MPHAHCHDLLNELSDYLDGKVPAELRAEIEHHLAECENCRAVVDTLRKTVQLYQTAPQPGLPAGARERLYRTLKLEDYLAPKA